MVSTSPPGEKGYLSQEESASSKKPSIAVLPFINMSEDYDRSYFADAISENIISTLSKIPNLFVIYCV
jgi:TolB-like protein